MPRVPSQKKRPAILASSIAAMISLSLLLAPQKAAADQYWDGTNTSGGAIPGQGGSGNWDSSTNWVDTNTGTNNSYDGSQTSHFAGSSGGTITLGSDQSFTTLQFETDGYTVDGNNGQFKLITLSSTGVINSDFSVHIKAQITGNGMQFGGSGTIYLENNQNNYSGGTTIGSGGSGPLVVISDDGDLGTAGNTVTMDGGSLGVTTGSTVTTSRPIVLNSGTGTFAPAAGGTLILNGVISGSASLTVNGVSAGGRVVLGNSANTYSGGTNLVNGTLVISSDGNLGDLNGVINFNGNATLETAATFSTSRSIALNGSTNSISADQNTVLTLNGPISGVGSFSATGSGTIVLANSGNSYAGGTNLNSGTVAITVDGNLGAASGVINFNGGTLETKADITTPRNINLAAGSTGTLSPDAGTTLTVNGQIIGSGNLNVAGGGTVVLTGGSNTYTGTTSISSGTLQAAAPNTIPSSTAMTVNGGTFDLNSFNQTVASLAGTGGTVSLGSATLTTGGGNTNTTFSGVITGTGGLTKTGTGTQTLSGSNTYSGATLISDGTLAAGVNNATSANSELTVNSGATFLLNGHNESVGSLSGDGTVTLGAGTLTVGAKDTSTAFNGTMSGTGGLTKVGAGTFTLNGTNITYTGATTVGGGTLLVSGAILNSASTLVLGGSTPVGGTFQLDGLSGDTTQTLNGLIINSSSNQIVVNNLGTSTTLDLRGTSGTLGITHNGGTVDFDIFGGTIGTSVTGATAIIMTHQTNDSTTGILGAWATVNGGAAFAKNDGNDNIVAYTQQAGESIAARGAVVPNNSQFNVSIDTAGTSGNDTLAATITDINTLRQNVGTDSTIDVAAGETLRVGVNGGILITPTAANLTIGTAANTGVLTAGGPNANTGGTLTLNNSASDANTRLTINSTITNNGTGIVSVVIAGTNTTVFNGANTYTGTTTISSGTLQIGTDNSLPQQGIVIVNSSGTLDVNDKSVAIGSLFSGSTGGGTVNLGTSGAGTLTIGANNASSSYSGQITGAGSIDKKGTGGVTLSGAITGVTSITQSGAGGLALSGPITGVGSISQTGSGVLVISGQVTGGTSISQTGSGTLTMSNSGNTYTGGTTLNSGRLNVNGNTADGTGTPLGTGTLTINGGTLGTTIQPTNPVTGTILTNAISLNGNFSIATNVNSGNLGAQNITLAGPINLNGATRTITGITDGGQVHFGVGGIGVTNEAGGVNFNTSFTKDGDYVAFIFDEGNTNKYTGLTTVNNGAFVVFQSSGGGAIKGNVDVEGNGSIDYIIGGGSADQIADTATVTVNSKGNTLSGSHFDGLELRGASDTIGALSGNGTVGLGGGTLTVGSNNTDTTFSGVIENGAFGAGGSLVKTGTGTLTLSGANTYTGATTINGGTLQAGAENTLSSASAVTVNSSGTLDLHGFSQNVASIAGTGTITLGSGTLTVSGNNSSTIFSGSISGSGGLAKTGTGTLTLTGVNNYTGTTTVTRGVLIAAPGGTTSVLNPASALVVGGTTVSDGGTFQLNHFGTTATTQVLNGLTVNAGNNVITVNTPVGTITTLDLSGASGTQGITRNANGFVDFRSSGGGALGVDAIIRTNQANDASGILGAWATVNGGSDFATNVGGVIKGLSSVAGGYKDIAATFDTVPNTNLNVRINSAAGTGSSMNDIILTKPVTSINTLTQNINTVSVVDLQGGTLRLGSDGGILLTPTGSNLTIGAAPNNGVLTAGSGSASTITLADNSASTLTINSAIEDNGKKGQVSVRLTGTGTTVFTGTNTYTGSTNIFAGTLRTDAKDALGTNSAVTISSGAALNVNGKTQTLGSLSDGVGGGNILLGSGGGALTIGTDNTSTSFSGAIIGTGATTGALTKVGTGTLTLAGNNSYTGGTTLAGGGLMLNSNSALGTDALTIGSTTSSSTRRGDTKVTLGSTVNGVAIGNAISVNEDFSVSGVTGGTFTLNGNVNLNGATRTITGVTNGSTVQFGGSIGNGGVTLNTVFTKSGDFVEFDYKGNNAYTGKTTVNNGVLLELLSSTAGGGIKGDVDIEGNGVVDFGNGSASVAQLAATATVTVNSKGNGQYAGLELHSANTTINILNGNKNGTIGLGDGTLTLNSGNFAGVIKDGFFAQITGGSLTKNSSGTLILSGSSSYHGATNLTAGTIQAGGAFALSASSAFQIAAGATLDINKFTQQVGSISDYSVTDNTTTPPTTTTSAGTIKLGSGLLETGFNGNSTTFSGVIQDGGVSKGKGGGLIQTGSGTLTLMGANTYTGITGLDVGATIVAGATNTISSKSQIALSGGSTFDMTDKTQSVGSLSNLFSLGGTIKLGSATLTIGNDNRTAFFSGVIQGTGGLIKVGSGVQFITGINTYTGDTFVTKGTLGLGAQGSLASMVTVNHAATFDNAGSLSFSDKKAQAVIVTDGGGEVFNESGGVLSALKGVVVNNQTGITRVINYGKIEAVVDPSHLTAELIAVDARGSTGGIVIGDFGEFDGAVKFNDNAANTVILATQYRPKQVIDGKTTYGVLQGSGGSKDTLELAGSSTDTLNIAQAQGYEFIHKVGGGMWTFIGTNRFVGGTRISGGSIDLQGNLVSNVRVDSDGSLSGVGTVTGNVLNLGLVLPGTAIDAFSTTVRPGVLTVRNNYTQGPNGALVIQVNGTGAGQYSQISIGGHAQLGGTLFVGGDSDHLKLKMGQKVTFLTAGGGVSGRFSDVSNPYATGSLIVADVMYGPDSVWLQGAQGSFRSIDPQFHLTPNQMSVATMLDSAAPDKRASKLVNFLDERPLKKLPGDYDHIAPEEMASVYRIGVSLSDAQSRNVQRRTADLRAGATGFSDSGFQTTGGNSYGGLAGPNGTDTSDKAGPQGIPNYRIGTFITGAGDFAHVGDSANARGYDLNTGGVTVGADYKLTPEIAVGVMAGYAGTNADLTEDGRILVNSGKAGVYGTYYKDHYYVDAAVSGGVSNYSTRRASLDGVASGSTTGGEFDALVDAGYDWHLDALTIGPTAAFEYTYVAINGFTENGSLTPLRYVGQHQASIRSTLGMHASYDWKLGKVIVRPEMSLAWQHEYGDRSFSIESALASGAGNAFTVADTQIGRDSLLFGAGVAVLWNPRTSTYFYYDADLLKKEYNSQSVTGGLRMNF